MKHKHNQAGILQGSSTIKFSKSMLTVHSKTMVAVLRDWDEDGNGGVDKKEFRKALIGLGYVVDRSIMDAL